MGVRRRRRMRHFVKRFLFEVLLRGFYFEIMCTTVLVLVVHTLSGARVHTLDGARVHYFGVLLLSGDVFRDGKVVHLEQAELRVVRQRMGETAVLRREKLLLDPKLNSSPNRVSMAPGFDCDS